jgi:hypothetical protein
MRDAIRGNVSDVRKRKGKRTHHADMVPLLGRADDVIE